MRFYIKCPSCGGLDLTDVTVNNLEEEVLKLKCNKCSTIFEKEFAVVISTSCAPSEKQEAFEAYLNQEDYKWNNRGIEEYKTQHLVNIKGYIERTCKSYNLNPCNFRVYNNVLAEINKRVR